MIQVIQVKGRFPFGTDEVEVTNRLLQQATERNPFGTTKVLQVIRMARASYFPHRERKTEDWTAEFLIAS